MCSRTLPVKIALKHSKFKMSTMLCIKYNKKNISGQELLSVIVSAQDAVVLFHWISTRLLPNLFSGVDVIVI